MAKQYIPAILAQDYNQAILQMELQKIATALTNLESPRIHLVPLSVSPEKPRVGDVVNADGTNWNPSHGAGLYEYKDSEWIPLFPLASDTILSQVQIVNTVTETTIFSANLAADILAAEEVIRLTLSGYYDTDAASDTWTLKVKLGGSTIHTIARQSTNNATDFGWELDIQATIRTAGASGTLIDTSRLLDDDTVKLTPDATVHTIDTTTANTLEVTLTWGLAKVGNDFRCDQGIIEYIH